MKKLRILLLLAAGVYLIATDSGQLFAQRAWAVVSGKPAFQIDFDAVSPALSENELLTKFPALKLKCQDEQSQLGNRFCVSDIRSFNGIPAEYVAFFFGNSGIRNIKLALHGKNHPGLVEKLRSQYGEWHSVAEGKVDVHGNKIVGWHLSSGILAISEAAPADSEATVLWINREAFFSQ